jgi:hypothetical protein
VWAGDHKWAGCRRCARVALDQRRIPRLDRPTQLLSLHILVSILDNAARCGGRYQHDLVTEPFLSCARQGTLSRFEGGRSGEILREQPGPGLACRRMRPVDQDSAADRRSRYYPWSVDVTGALAMQFTRFIDAITMNWSESASA